MTDIRTLPVTAELIDYVVDHGTWPVDEVLADLRTETLALGGAAGMQIGTDQGALLTLLTRLVGVRRAVEVGTFTGYSALCIARGLADGRPPAVLRRQRGVDRDRPAGLGARRRRRPHRPAHRAGPRDAAGAARPTPPSTSRSSTPTSPATSPTRGAGPPRAARRAAAGRQRAVVGTVVDARAPTTTATPAAIRAFNDLVAADDRVEVVILPDRTTA